MIATTQVSPQLSQGGLIALCCGFALLLCTPAWADEEIDLKQCPDKVQKTIKAEAAGGKIIEVEREESDSGVVYEAEIKIEGSVYEVEISEDAKLLSKELDDEDSEADDDDESAHEKSEGDEKDEQEEAVTLKQLPKAVRSTLQRESRGGEIEELEKETEDGSVVYSAEVEYETDAGELVYEVEIAENGVLLSKVLEDEEHEAEHEHHAEE